MNQRPIERSSDTFRDIDFRAAIERSNRFWNSPEGKRARIETEERQKRAIRKNRGYVRFPELVRTRPAVSGAAEVADWAARFGV